MFAVKFLRDRAPDARRPRLETDEVGLRQRHVEKNNLTVESFSESARRVDDSGSHVGKIDRNEESATLHDGSVGRHGSRVEAKE